MDTAKILATLKETEEARIFEAYHVEHFECYRHRPDGNVEEVLVTILDAGPTTTDRYMCHIKSKSGREAGGNPAPTPEVAIDIAHWEKLDYTDEQYGPRAS